MQQRLTSLSVQLQQHTAARVVNKHTTTATITYYYDNTVSQYIPIWFVVNTEVGNVWLVVGWLWLAWFGLWLCTLLQSHGSDLLHRYIASYMHTCWPSPSN